MPRIGLSVATQDMCAVYMYINSEMSFFSIKYNGVHVGFVPAEDAVS